MAKRSDAETVAAYMAAFDPARRPMVEALREVIKTAGPELAERIKWNAPSYHLASLDMAAMNFHDKSAVRLVFVYASGLPADGHGLLEGEYADRRLAIFRSLDDVERDARALAFVVKDWLALAAAGSSGNHPA
jgi:hypothetical protein